ncbi:MAG: ATP synthase epsilon chain [Clostridia bacterium 41_269]|nr:MAG: ATP synthase epsilon chain [Clostridia bacterium 41_269]
MAEKILTMEVVTPERHVIKTQADSIVVPAAEGYLGILSNHAPLITSLRIGVVRYSLKGQEKKMAISGGFMEVADNVVTILADTAELAEEIDVDRAIAAKERALQRLRERKENIDYVRAQLALQRALARLKAAGKI